MMTEITRSSHSEHRSESHSNAVPECPYTLNPSIEIIIMKALLKNIPIFLVTLSLIFLVACASSDKKESTGEFIDDTVITTRVKAEILKEDSLKVTEIKVETFKGVVQLSGFVSSTADQQTAVRIAKGVPGVVSVKNDMRTK